MKTRRLSSAGNGTCFPQGDGFRRAVHHFTTSGKEPAVVKFNASSGFSEAILGSSENGFQLT